MHYVFPEDKVIFGTYALLVNLPVDLTLRVGRLGSVTFPANHYAYVGSALGSGGLQARVGRHLRRSQEKRHHWHIDALTSMVEILEVWYLDGDQRQECFWAKMLSISGSVAANGFGASDCRCLSHLIRLGDIMGVEQGWMILKGKAGSRLQRRSVQ